MAAGICLAALGATLSASSAFARGASFGGNPPFAAHPPVSRGPSQGMRADQHAGAPRADFRRAPVRIVRRGPRVFGSYAPYYAATPYYAPAPVEEQPATAPAIVETETPVYVNVGLPAERLVVQRLCTGPEIIEFGKPKKPAHPLQVIYAMPSPCVAQSAVRRGPGIYYMD